MLRRLLDVLYPRNCAGCGSGAWPFCPACAGALRNLSPPRCARCWAPASSEVEACRACPPEPVSLARSAFRFEGPARAAVLKLKFGGDKGVAGALGRAAAAVAPAGPSVVTWVPLSRARRRKRGFDQAELLARAVGGERGLPVVKLLSREVDLPPQARRSATERRTALAGAFEPVAAVWGPVLLVDDVLTTGATSAECAEALLSAGAASIAVVTAARSVLLSSRRLQPGSVVARGNLPR